MRIPKLLTLALFTVILAVSNPIYGLSSVEQQQIVPLFQSSCGNGVCDPGENTDNCPSDCSVFIGGYCGDGTCDSGEESACPQDCGVSCVGQTCIEGYFFDWESCTCVPSEDSCLPQTCSPGEYFDQSLCQCVASSFCGDGSCGSGEDSINCAQDCPPPSTSLCGDFRCDLDAGESNPTCPADCVPTCGDGVCDYSKETVVLCPADCPLTALNCGDAKCEPGEAVACPECWGRFDHRCEFGEGSYFRSPDCYTVYPGCSCYEMIANHQGLAGIYGNPATIYRNPGYSIPVEPLIWVSIAFFMRGRRIKQNDPRT